MSGGADKLIKNMVLVGDGGVGKTALLVMYKQNVFPVEHIPTIFENYESSVVVDGKSLVLSLFDTAGQEGYDTLRCLSYPNTDTFIVCFDVTSTDSFRNIQSKWIPELKSQCSNPQILLVGTKSDLRTNKERQFEMLKGCMEMVTEAQAQKLAYTIKAYGYVECSALTGYNVEKVFNEATRAALKLVHSRKQTRCCHIL